MNEISRIVTFIVSSDSHQREHVLSQLQGAMEWCRRNGSRNDPAGSLRTKALKPDLVVLANENDGWWDASVVNPTEKVDQLCRKRDTLMESSTREPLENERRLELEALSKGRVLRFYPHESLCDGAAWQSSAGFFDQWNIPPWDTWFWYAVRPDGLQILYSWVPPEFVHLAAAGVSVNPECCLEWLDINHPASPVDSI